MTSHLLLPSYIAYEILISSERNREGAVKDAILGWGNSEYWIYGQRIRAAPKAPLRKRPTPFPSAVHRSFFKQAKLARFAYDYRTRVLT